MESNALVIIGSYIDLCAVAVQDGRHMVLREFVVCITNQRERVRGLIEMKNDKKYHLMSEVLPTPPSPMTTILMGL